MPGNDSYTKLLLHCNGVDASTTFTDNSPSAHTMTANGNAQIDTAQYKLGTASGLFDGAGDYVSTPDSADWNFGTGDFTVDFWIRRNGSQADFTGIINAADSSNVGWTLHFGYAAGGNANKLRLITRGGVVDLVDTDVLPDTSWNHVAIIRYGNNLKLYVNGVEKATYNCTGVTYNSSSRGLNIGRLYTNSDTKYFNGWLDEIRVSKGIARWTADFTPPTIEYALDFDELTINETITLSENWEISTNPEQVIDNESVTLSENWSIEENPKFEILNENIALSESWSITRLFHKILNIKLYWKKLYTNGIKSSFDWIIAKSINTSLTWLGIQPKIINTDLRWLSIGYNDVPPIAPSDIQILINSVDMVVANDVDLQSGNIQHTIGQKSIATFTLARKHDDLDRTHAGAASQITNQNPVQIYIKGNLEFDGKISNLSVNSETETVQVTAQMNEPADNRHTIDIPLPSVNEKIHLYHCLVNNVAIDNPYIDPGETNPEYYKGIQIDLGTKIQQQTDAWRSLESIWSGKGVIAASIEDGTFVPKPNYNYFWNVLAKNIRTGSENVNFRYIGTSLGSIATDLWVLIGASPLRQKIKDNIETALGYYYVGTAPYKEISSKNGQLIIAAKYQDQDDGLYHVYDEAYNYIDFAKLVAGLEYQKLLTVGGQVVPSTSAGIEITFDAYYYYTVQLLTRINITNTTVANTFKNTNGFPTSVKGITINFSTMKITLSTDNRLSQDEIDEIDAQMPDAENPIYLVPAYAVRVYRKFDLKTWSYVS
jgi:hypothetical protein